MNWSKHFEILFCSPARRQEYDGFQPVLVTILVVAVSPQCSVTQIMVSSAVWSILISFSMNMYAYISCSYGLLLLQAGFPWGVFALSVLGIIFNEGIEEEATPWCSDHPLFTPGLPHRFTSVDFEGLSPNSEHWPSCAWALVLAQDTRCAQDWQQLNR